MPLAVSIVLKVVSPARYWLTLVSPPYSYLEFFTHLENVVLLIIAIETITTISFIYIWRHRKEVWKRPKQKYEEALKS
jgi:glycerol-3-phosphate acyltransferase PlsY